MSTYKKASIRRRETEDFEDIGSFNDLTELSTTFGYSKSKAGLYAADEKSSYNLSNLAADTTGVSTFIQYIQESSDVLFAACELSHIRCAKLLTIRSDQNIKLNFIDFFRFYGATWEYLTATESLCGRMCFPLKGCILSQAKYYILHFHEEKSKQIALLVENEQWMQADIPIDFQHITEQLQLSRTLKKDSINSLDEISEGSEMNDSEIDLTTLTAVNSETQSPTTIQSDLSDSKTIKFLMVDGNKYYVVGSVLMFLKTLTDYVNCAERLQTLIPEILNRIFELLKVSLS